MPIVWRATSNNARHRIAARLRFGMKPKLTVGNERARALYVAVGFTSVAIEPRYLKIGVQYFDIEWMHLSVSREDSN